MTTTVRVFVGVAAGMAVLTGAYWYLSYEWVGTIILGFMGLASLLVAAYALPHRHRRPPEDRPDASPEHAAGDTVGSFPRETAWPVVLAVAAAAAGLGLLYGGWLVAVGLLLGAAAVAAWAMTH